MPRKCLWVALILALNAIAAGRPKIDKTRFESYVRYAEGYGSEIQIAIDDPVPSPFPGFFRILVHLSRSASKINRVYYVSADGAHFVNGSIWDLNSTPFLDTLEHLPTAGPSFGPADAKITMVVFSDFQCPYCREFAGTIRQNLPQKYPNDVRVIFKNFPIESIHNWAKSAAEAADCITAQNHEAFWAFHDWIFDHQQEVTNANVADRAVAIGKDRNLDIGKLSTCISTHASRERVEESVEEGRELQIQETPTFFVNGRTVPGARSWAELDSIIQLELGRPSNVPGPPAQKCCEVRMPAATKR